MVGGAAPTPEMRPLIKEDIAMDKEHEDLLNAATNLLVKLGDDGFLTGASLGGDPDSPGIIVMAHALAEMPKGEDLRKLLEWHEACPLFGGTPIRKVHVGEEHIDAAMRRGAKLSLVKNDDE